MSDMQRTLTANFTADASGFSPAVDEVVQKLKALNVDFEQNKAKVKELSFEMKAYEKELQKNNTVIKNLQTRSQAYQERLQELIVKTNNGTSASSEQQKQMAKLRAVIESCESQIKKHNTAQVNLRDKIAECVSKIAVHKAAQKQLSAEINDTNKELTEQRKAANDVGTAMRKAGEDISVFNDVLKANLISDVLKAGVREVIQLSGELFKSLIGSNSEMEGYLTSFTTMLGSAEKAQALVEDMRKFAADTPLELTDVTSIGTLLMNYGVGADELIGKLTQIGDLSSGNAEKMNRISLAYGQMLAKGKVTGEELRQMTEAGIPMLQTLADTMGVSTAEMSKMISEGKVSIDMLDAAIASLTTGTGKFAGMMEQQSQTLSGLMSTMSDNITQFGTKMGEGAFEQVKELISGVADEIQKMTDSGELDSLAEDLGEPVAIIVEDIKEVALELLPELVDKVQELAQNGELKDMAEDIGNGIEFTAKTIANITKAIVACRGAIVPLTTSAIALKVALSIGPLVTKLTTAIKGLTAAAAANPWILLATALAGIAAHLISIAAHAEDCNDRMEELQQSAGDFYEQAKESKQAAESVKQLTDEYKRLVNSSDDSVEAKKRLEEIQTQLVDTYGAEASKLDLVNGKYQEQLGILEQIANKKDETAKTQINAAYLSAEDAQKAQYGIEIRDDKIDKEQLELLKTYFVNNTAPYGDYGSITKGAFDDVMTFAFKEGVSYKDRYNYISDIIAQFEKQFGVSNIDTQLYEDLANAQQEMYTAWQDYEKIVSAYNNNLYENPSTTHSSAEYYEEQGKARLAVYEQQQKQIAAEVQDREAEYDKQKKDLDYLLDMEEISQAEYYEKLAILRDTYLDENTDKWRSANVAIHKYQQALLKELSDGAVDDAKKTKEALSEVEQAYRDTLNAIDAEIARHNRDKEDEELNDQLSDIENRLKYERLSDFDRYELEKEKQELLEQREEMLWKREMDDKKALAEDTYTAAKEAYEESSAHLNEALAVAMDIFKAIGGTAQAVSNTNTTNNTTQNNSFLMQLVGATADEIVEAVKKALSSDI